MRRCTFGLFLVLALAACSHAPTERSAAEAPPPLPPSLPLRLVDQAGDAEVSGDLVAAYAALTHPLVSPSPLPSSPGAFPRALQVAFAEPELTRLYASAAKTAAEAPTRGRNKIDFTWNRTRGVYEAREALFLPSGARYRYTIPAGPPARLTGELALSPGGKQARLAVALDGKTVGELRAGPPDLGRWRHIAIEVPARTAPTTLSLAVDGDGTMFLGTPILRVAKPAADSRPNVLFIVVDTLRADALGPMPKLRGYAARGARYSQAITTATWTRPSLIGALGGDLPTRLGHSAEEMIPSERERRRFRAVRPPLLPRRLASAGWDTRAIGNNFFLLGFPRIGLDLGLDAVTDVRHPVLDTPAITAEAIRYLEGAHEAPFFLYLHYDAPHWPYTPPPASLAAARGSSLTGLTATRDPAILAYLGEAAYADGALGEVFAALDRTGLAEKTIVVVIGDHGEVFDPAHAHTIEALGQPTLHHHGWSAYDEIARVPLVIAWPGHLPPRIVETQTSLVDLAPTLADLTGIASVGETKASTEPTRGRSMATALLSTSTSWPLVARPAFVEGQNVRALRADGWLYLVRGDARLKKGNARSEVHEELYEMNTDPLQHQDRSGDPTAPLAIMRARFAQSAPSLPSFAEPVIHLALAESERSHVLRGELRCPTGRIALRAIERGRAEPARAQKGSAITIELESGGKLELVLDPPDAPFELLLRRDDLPIDADHLLVGPLALPLFGGRGRTGAPELVAIATGRLAWLDAVRPPYLGDTGDVVLWRDPAGPDAAAQKTAAADGEVATMMQRWGYAQPAK